MGAIVMRKKFGPTTYVLGLLCLMYFLSYIDRVNMATAAPSIKQELGLSNTQLGIIFSAFAYPYAIFQSCGGWIADRFGAWKTLFFCCIVWAGATVLTGLAGGIVSLFIIRCLLGAGEGATLPTATRAMQDWTPVQKRGFAQGITHAFARLGNAVTPPIVAALIIYWSWRGSFIVLGCVSLIWAALWFWYFRDDPSSHKGISKEELLELPKYSRRGASDRVPVKALIKRLFPVTVVYFCYGWTLWLYLNWLPSFFKEGYHLDLKNSAIFSSSVFVAGVLGDIVGGYLSDTIYRRTGRLNFARAIVISGSMLGAAASLASLFLFHDLVATTILLSLGFFFLEVVIGPVWSVPMDIAPSYAGTASGIMAAGSAIAGIISPPAFGAIVDWTGNWTLPFLASIGLLLLGAVVAPFMRPDKPFLEPEMPSTGHRPAAAAIPVETSVG